MIAYVVVGLAVGIPVGLLSANFAVGGIAGFGAMMVFGVASIFVAVLNDSHGRSPTRPRPH